MNKAYLCLGGNLGNCIETFTKAMVLLEDKGLEISQRSSDYISEAWGMENAPDFYNRVLAVTTKLSSDELMELLLNTEELLGRKRTGGGTYESRPIDMDILLFNDEIISTPFLEVPHPRLHLRKFVLLPLQEIAPQLMHPVLKRTTTQLLEVCPDKSNIKIA